MKNKSTARELDQFYTNPTYAQTFLNKISQTVDLTSYDHLLEPSAGNGSFYNLLDPVKRIGLDLEPKAPGIIHTNFFDWSWPMGKRIATIGNPPFGKNASLAVKFFNRAAKFSDVIAFIIPRTFRKASIINRLHDKFHLIYDETVPPGSFIFNDNPYDVWCCAQIWVKKEEKRTTIPTLKISQIKEWFEIVAPDQSDFAVQRVGGRAGQIRTQDYKTFSPLSNFFIKAHKPEVLDIFKQINFETVKFNTAGNPSVSPSEMVELWVEEAKKQGFDIDINKTIPKHLVDNT